MKGQREAVYLVKLVLGENYDMYLVNWQGSNLTDSDNTNYKFLFDETTIYEPRYRNGALYDSYSHNCKEFMSENQLTSLRLSGGDMIYIKTSLTNLTKIGPSEFTKNFLKLKSNSEYIFDYDNLEYVNGTNVCQAQLHAGGAGPKKSTVAAAAATKSRARTTKRRHHKKSRQISLKTTMKRK